METEAHIFTGWEITSLREQQLSRVDDTIVDAGLFIGTLDESPEYRLELLIMLLQGTNLIVDDVPVCLTSEDSAHRSPIPMRLKLSLKTNGSANSFPITTSMIWTAG
jgi:hypothetical protein